uniref:Cryptochrome DASH n=1 Tax=Tetraselmis chuii TaxID=63592 RepID=A0A7S1SVM2_9CHLO|mmetsp:Transcript_3064/g.5576  ORF Transcript_3064/g.5576 Transcript_3064/m.5576 type:complete len:554 (+) Transcript_3064:419-2080(+)
MARADEPNVTVCWFRNDLRLHDNVIVHQAAQAVESGRSSAVLPIYCFDPLFFKHGKGGFPKTGAYRAQFLLESVLDLKANLRAVGSDLLVCVGRPEEKIPDMLRELQAGGRPATVLAQTEVTSEELGTDRRLRAAMQGHGKLQLEWGSTMYHLQDLPYRGDLSDLKGAFTNFRVKVEEKSGVRDPLPAPKKGSLPLPSGMSAALLDFSPSPQELPGGHGYDSSVRAPADIWRGGETAALQRLKYYLWDTDLIADYFNTRNGMLGGDYSTKFAPWLAHGCLSPRTIYAEIQRYQAQRTKNKSTYWVIFELIWRDFYKFFALKHGNAIFFEDGTEGRAPQWAPNQDELFERWRTGRTGMPLVDANMRELNATGFMSNRGRQNVASYLVLDLGVDWRKGADYFESLLIDYDCASNWGNWVAAAGLTGGRLNKFNITKQSKDYDLEGTYLRHWIPELANVPASRIHEPWLMSKAEMDKYGVQIGEDYPQPPKKPATAYYTGGGGGGRGDYRGGGGRGGPQRPGSARGGGGRGGGGERRYSGKGGAARKPRGEFDRFG